MGRIKAGRGKHLTRLIPSHVRVHKDPDLPEGHKFRACVRIGRGNNGWVRGMKRGSDPTNINLACASGRNPRKAVAAALRKLASRVGKRTGAFRGL